MILSSSYFTLTYLSLYVSLEVRYSCDVRLCSEAYDFVPKSKRAKTGSVEIVVVVSSVVVVSVVVVSVVVVVASVVVVTVVSSVVVVVASVVVVVVASPGFSPQATMARAAISIAATRKTDKNFFMLILLFVLRTAQGFVQILLYIFYHFSMHLSIVLFVEQVRR